MITLIICKGLPASGKTTFSKGWVQEDPTHRVRINRDDIRNMLGPYWIPNRENLVTIIENNCIISSLLNGYSVIIDATNFRHKFNNHWVLVHTGLTEDAVVIEEKYFDVSVEECIKRDSMRTIGKVGKDVILKMAKKYLQ